MDMIPVIGSTIGGALVTLVALTVSVPVAVATLAFYVAFRLFEDYVLLPRVMRQAVDVPPIVTVVAFADRRLAARHHRRAGLDPRRGRAEAHHPGSTDSPSRPPVRATLGDCAVAGQQQRMCDGARPRRISLNAPWMRTSDE